MVAQVLINGRYERKDKLGEGGMGVVYRAHDISAKRDVALKTMRDTADPVAVELFSKEWSVLAGLVHPNIVDLLDCGEFTEDGRRKPFFVMPLLPGKTLGQLIHSDSQRLTVERTVEILRQVCRGLQAAHERGLVHRDLKPSNIFVMEDDTAKIIDFGVVHLTGMHSATGFKGTVQYMAPEQLDLKPASVYSDIFSLGVVSYEALTGRQPFAKRDFDKTAEAVRTFIPPPISHLNPTVNELISKVIHKAMAKQARYRYGSARDFADDLEKASRNVALPRFDSKIIGPRIELARKSFTEGDMQFALEIVNALEAEGNMAPELTDLRRQVEQGSRQRTLKQLLEVARTRFEQGEDLLAIQKVDEALQIDPDNAEALRLHSDIESRRSERQIDDWLRLAQDHLDRGAFGECRKAIQEALKVDSRGWRANQLLAELNRQEQEINKTRAEKELLSKAAKDNFDSGEISTALSKLERVLELIRRTPDRGSPDKDAEYQKLYNLVRSEHDAIRIAYEDACRHLAEKSFSKALTICEDELKKYPHQDLFRALKLKIGEQERQDRSAYGADVARRVDAEPDLDRKFNIIKDAVNRYPNELQFQQLLGFVRERRDFVQSIVAKARNHEERGQFAEAIGQWEIIGNIYPQYPDLAFEVEQLRRRREEQSRDEEKARWVDVIERALEQRDYKRARESALKALDENPGDGEIAALNRLAQQGIERGSEVQRLLEEGSGLIARSEFQQGSTLLKRALDLDENNPAVRLALIKGLVEQAKELMKDQWQAAEPLIQSAEQIDPSNTDVRRLRSIIQDNRRREAVGRSLAEAREFQANGDITKALKVIEEGLQAYPAEPRLWQLRKTLDEAASELQHRGQRNQDLTALRNLQNAIQRPSDQNQVQEILKSSETIRSKHADDQDFNSIFNTIQGYAATRLEVQQAAVGDTQESIFHSEPRTFPLRETIRHEKEIQQTPPVIIPPKQQTDRYPKKPSDSTGKEQEGKFPNWSSSRWATIVALPLLVILVWLGTYLWRTAKKGAPEPSSANEFRVSMSTDPAGALIHVDGRLVKELPAVLPAGAHRVEASLPGYVTSSQRLNVGPNTGVVRLALVPEPAHLRLSTDFGAGTVLIDGQRAGDLASGLFSKDDLGFGDHTLQITDKGRELLSLNFKAQPAGITELLTPPKVRDLFVIANFSGKSRIYAGPTALRMAAGGAPPLAFKDEAVEVPAGQNEIQLVTREGKTQRTLSVEAANAPTLLIYANSGNATRALLTITSNVDSPQIMINGKAREWRLNSGRYAGRLDPGTYTVRLTKPGYADDEKSVDLAEGDAKTLDFSLTQKPLTSMLQIEGGTAGAEVLLDQVSIGHLDQNGSFSNAKVSPGLHDIAIKKDLFEQKDLGKQNIAAGQPLRITAEQARLTPFGSLSIQVAAPGAKVRYKRDGEAEWHSSVNGQAVPVRGGRYSVSATADGFEPWEQAVMVEPGATKMVTGTLARTQSVQTHVVKDLFGPSIAWAKNSSGWWEYKGDNYGWLTANQGTFMVDIQRRSSRFGLGGAVAWVVGYHNDGKDKVEYHLGKNGALTRKVTIAGKSTEAKAKNSSLTGELIRLRIAIQPGSIVISDGGGNVIDSYAGSTDLTNGRFGFKSGFYLSINPAK